MQITSNIYNKVIKNGCIKFNYTPKEIKRTKSTVNTIILSKYFTLLMRTLKRVYHQRIGKIMITIIYATVKFIAKSVSYNDIDGRTAD